MLPKPERNVWVYHSPVDLRKSYHSLSRLVDQELKKQAKSGDAFIFINRSKNLTKVLWWDRTGWCLLLKKLSIGRYRISGDKDLKELQLGNARYFFDGL